MLAAAFPGRDPLSYTIAVFEARLAIAPMVIGYLRGFTHDDIQRHLGVEKTNREIVMKERLSNYYG